VDHRPIGSGKIGPVGSTLQRLYREVTRGLREEYASWLTPVYPARVASESNARNGHDKRPTLNGVKHKRGKQAATAE